MTNLLRIKGWSVNHKLVKRIWHQEGLKVPKRQPGRGRLWLNNGSCIRFRPLHENHVWSYDFVSAQTDDGRDLKLLTVRDEYTRQCLAIKVGRRTRVHDVLEVLADLLRLARSTVVSTFGQWAGVHGASRTAVAGQARCAYALHRTRQSVGERL